MEGKIIMSKDKKLCKSCGAPITKEVCPYCGMKNERDKNEELLNIPSIDCKEVNLTFFSVVFPAIFAFAFGFAGFGMPLIFMSSPAPNFPAPMFLFFVPFMAVGVGAFAFMITPFIRLFKINRYGKEIEGTVHSYTNDNVTINGIPGQVVRILVETDEGPRYLKYQLGSTDHPYKIGSKIRLKVYKDIFRIIEKKKYYFDGE